MEHLASLVAGLINAASLLNLLFAFSGCLLGTLIGVLPGLGPTSAIAILLPLTNYFPPTGGIIMLAGIYYGSMYGGSTTSILMNIPGEVSSVPTTFDGYQMAQQGRAGPALGISAIGSFVGGTLSILALTFAGPRLAEIAFLFGPAEYFSLIVFALVTAASLSSGSLTRGLLMLLMGLVLACVGSDTLTGINRFTFGSVSLLSGIDLISMVVGLFGVGEILVSFEAEIVTVAKVKLGKLMPAMRELRDCALTILRSTVVGFGLGLLPGMTPAITSFIAYDVEKKCARNPSRFGKGAIEGVCAPETANNATAVSGFIPMLVFGIPTSATMALLLAGMMIYGLDPGPLLFTKHTDFFWTFMGSMYIGNFMCIILNLPLVGLWARIAYIPYKILAPIILGVCFLGSYSSRSSMLDVAITVIFGIIGYVLRKGNWPIAPVILGFILGPMLEGSLRQSLQIYDGSLLAMFVRPIPATLGIACLGLITLTVYLRTRR